MKDSISYLPESKQQELQRITQLIVETVSPEKIILFGSYATGNWVEDRYTEGHITYEYISDYDLLVVTKAEEKRKDYEITDQIENRLRFRTPINVITHDIEYINRQLSEGQYFFTDIVKEGILLYELDTTPFAHLKELSANEKREIAQKDFDKWFKSAFEFVAAAEFLAQRKQFNIAVFQLHQAAERTYNALLLVFTGYKPKTHNLDKLMRLTKRFFKDITLTFPRNSPNEEHLFNLLLKGYIDARYKDDYTITEAELNELITRVKALQNITDKVCQNKIASFV